MKDAVEEINLIEFIEAYKELSMMQLWDWLNYNGYIKPESEIK